MARNSKPRKPLPRKPGCAMSQTIFGPRSNPFYPNMFARPREVDHPRRTGQSSMGSCMS